MKNLIFSILVANTTLFASNLHVQITGLLNTKGEVYIGVYKKAENFPNVTKSYKAKIVKLQNTTLNYTFQHLPKGNYAIAVFHDENSNHSLDKNFLGVPSEGYGFSNNIKPLFRAANFEESQFVLKKDTSLTIKLLY